MIADRAQFFEGKKQSEAFAQEFVTLAAKHAQKETSVSLQFEPGGTPARRWLQLCFRSPAGAVMVCEPMDATEGAKGVLERIERHLKTFDAAQKNLLNSQAAG